MCGPRCPVPMLEPSGDLALANLAGFVRVLKRFGFAVSTATTAQLAEAARVVGMASPLDVREAFRSLTAVNAAQSSLFDELFNTYFTGDTFIGLDSVVDSLTRQHAAAVAPRIGAVAVDGDTADEDLQEVLDVTGGSAVERLMDVDFGDLEPDEADAIAALLASMQWTVSSVASRRWRPSRGGEVRNLRRTLRSMTGPKAELIPLAYSMRRPRQRPLVVIADISGSMQRYSEMLLRFVHGAQFRFRRIEAFVFATRLTRVTRQLKRRDAGQALRQVAGAVPDWSSGTRIGEAIGLFNDTWSRRVCSGGPVVLIISDGWDTGDPSVLAHEMHRLRRTVHRTIWLNPLASREGFTPEARGMAAALPHVDDLVAGGTARNLADLIDLLQGSQEAKGFAVA